MLPDSGWRGSSDREYRSWRQIRWQAHKIPVHAAGDGAGRIFTMTDVLQELRNFVSDRAALGGNLIADAPHYHTRIVAIVVQHIHHIAFCHSLK